MSTHYRQARLADIPVMASIRDSVRENVLVSTVLDAQDYADAISRDGRAWVCEVEGAVVGFSCGRRVQGDVWALFLRQDFEGQGIGNALMERVETWMFEQGLDEIWLVTEPETRAERLYQRRGWTKQGIMPTGEARYLLRRR